MLMMSKSIRLINRYKRVRGGTTGVDKIPNSRRVHLKSNYLRLERNDKTACSKVCILYKYSNHYLLIELDDETSRPVRAWRSAPAGIFPMHTQYLALEAFHNKLVCFETVFANNLEPLRFSTTKRMPSIVPIYHYDVAEVIRLLRESRGYRYDGAVDTNSSTFFTSNKTNGNSHSGNDDSGACGSSHTCNALSAPTDPKQRKLGDNHVAEKRAEHDYNFYKSLDPSITYKDYLEIVS